ncbi:glycosyltransferase family 2 protein [Amnibacterium flavum]|uniref:Glycosyltransferase n=1 Tax=Amnibacterium flavum TaxID=2173173 RepID=A0A2V1HY44_9MICO|nr:glycosyltransferase [Amnibacterium flavum]PVZ95657.1 glycosyltransferase [Amnibacterium flavum]
MTARRAVPGNRWDLLDGIDPVEAPKVSVVVVHFEQHDQLRRTLAALARQTLVPHQVIVVDDGSAEPPVVPSGVELIVQEDLGFRLAAARNAGVRAATGEVVVFLDADTAPEPAYLERMSRLPALTGDTVAVGRRRHADLSGLGPDEPIELAERAELDEPEWLRSAYRRSRNLLDADDRSYRYLIGAVLACSRDFVDEVGGFDESLIGYGGEDWDWAYRAWLAGAVFAHVPDAVAWHDGPDFAGRESSDAGDQKTRETLRLAERIPVPGSRARGLRSVAADIVAVVGSGMSRAQAAITADSLLAAVPGLDVVVNSEFAEIAALDSRIRAADDLADAIREGWLPLAAPLDRVRKIIVVEAPLLITDDRALREILAPERPSPPREVRVSGAGGAAALRVLDVRSLRRQLRWHRNDLSEVEAVTVPWIVSAGDNLEAHLGGWAT